MSPTVKTTCCGNSGTSGSIENDHLSRQRSCWVNQMPDRHTAMGEKLEYKGDDKRYIKCQIQLYHPTYIIP